MSDDPKKLADGESLAEFMAATFGDWYNAPPQVCSVCGKSFRDMTGVAEGNPRTDGICFECEHERDQRRQVALDARTQIARHVPPQFEGKSHELCTNPAGLKHEGCRRYHAPPGDPAASEAISSWHWARRGGGSLYLWGDTGTGKSHLAYGLVQREIEQGRKVVALEWTQFLGKLRASFGSRYQGRSEAEIEAELEAADLIVLDDVGSGKITEWAAEKLWVIVNGRYIAQRQLVITSNLPPMAATGADLVAALGAGGRRTVSRLTQICDVVQVRGGDLRGQLELKAGAA